MTTWLHVAAFVLALVALFGCLCRIDSLQWGRHEPLVIIMHCAMAAACCAAMYRAWVGESDAIDFASVVSVLSWLRVSVPTWGRGNVPVQFDTAPTPLDEGVYPYIAGGGK